MRQSFLKHDQVATAPSTQPSAPVPTLDALYQRLHSSPSGLTSGEARKRFKETGPNEPAVVQRGATLRQLLVFLANPLVLILLLASIITAILGEVLNASIIIS